MKYTKFFSIMLIITLALTGTIFAQEEPGKE
jgi:hypothetical protein